MKGITNPYPYHQLKRGFQVLSEPNSLEGPEYEKYQHNINVQKEAPASNSMWHNNSYNNL